MKIDRDLQRQILEEANQHYPSDAGNVLRTLNCNDEHGSANAFYLEELGLIKVSAVALHGHRLVNSVKITAQGIDFLADDGGVGATLAVVTIKIHEDSLRELLTQKIDDSGISNEEKSRLKESIKELPGEGVKHLMTKFVDLGFENLPKAFDLISKATNLIPLQ